MKNLEALRRIVQTQAAAEAWSHYRHEMTEKDCYDIAEEIIAEMVIDKILTAEEAKKIQGDLIFDLSPPDVEDDR
jgi:hypothetical protein